MQYIIDRLSITSDEVTDDYIIYYTIEGCSSY